MATAYAVNSRLLRGFCASGPKSIAHKRSFGKSPAPAEGRFPGVFSRSGQGRAARHGRGPKIRTFAADSGQQAKAVPRQAQPGGHPGQDGRPSGRRYGAGTSTADPVTRGHAGNLQRKTDTPRPCRRAPACPPPPGAGCQRRADRLQCGHVCKNRPPARGSTGLHAGPGRKP